MPPKRQKRGGKRRLGGRRSGGLQAQNARTTETIIGIPFLIQQTTSGNGVFSSYETPLSLTANSSVVLDPFNLGGRLATVAELYNEYNVLGGYAEFMPHGSTSGVVGSGVATGTTTPTYAPRSFALGINADPAFTSTTFIGVLQAGGKDCNTTRRARIPFPAACCNKWRWVTTTASSPGSIDYRMTAFGVIMGRFFDNSTTTTLTYGSIVLRMRVAFRGPAQIAAQIGRELSATERVAPDSEEIKSDESFVVSHFGGAESDTSQKKEKLAASVFSRFSSPTKPRRV